MRLALLSIIVLLFAGCSASPPLDDLGAYRLEDGRVVSIRRSEGKTLRYRIYPTGETGRLYYENDGSWVSGEGFSSREPAQLHVRFNADGSFTWMPENSNTQEGRRFLNSEMVEFSSDGVTLRGQLYIPPGSGPFPAVVLVHGSGSQSAIQYFYNGDFLAAKEIATLVFDKRGSGLSEGDFTFDFNQLARDVVAATDVLADHEAIDADRIGLCGYSQGAWVAPLAASLDPRIHFVSVSYGMIESPSDEALWETQQLLRSRGVDDAGILEATPLIRSAVDIVASNFSDGWDEFYQEKAATKDAPWRKKLDGSPVQQLLLYPKWLAKIVGPRLAPDGLDWGYSSDTVLDSLGIPMTWLLGTADSSAPNGETIKKLRAYREAGKPFELILFEGADHGMLEFEDRGGERVYSGYAPGYFQAEAENVLRMSARD